MNLTVQGKEIEYDGETHLLALLESMREEVLYVTVRHNGEILSRRDFESIPLKEGDVVDFLYFMGGGTRAGGGAKVDGGRCGEPGSAG